MNLHGKARSMLYGSINSFRQEKTFDLCACIQSLFERIYAHFNFTLRAP